MLKNQKLLELIGKNIATQDNRATDAPLWIVQQSRRFYGYDLEDSEDNVEWVSHDDVGGTVDKETARELQKQYDETLSEPEGYYRVGYRDEWVFVTACFTQAGCEEYIRINGHNLNNPRIYAGGSYRNAEYRLVREALQELYEKSWEKQSCGIEAYRISYAFKAGYAAAVEGKPKDACDDPHWIAGWEKGYWLRDKSNEETQKYLQSIGMEPLGTIVTQ